VLLQVTHPSLTKDTKVVIVGKDGTVVAEGVVAAEQGALWKGYKVGSGMVAVTGILLKEEARQEGTGVQKAATEVCHACQSALLQDLGLYKGTSILQLDGTKHGVIHNVLGEIGMVLMTDAVEVSVLAANRLLHGCIHVLGSKGGHN